METVIPLCEIEPLRPHEDFGVVYALFHQEAVIKTMSVSMSVFVAAPHNIEEARILA
jgi:hypothetical protein